MVKSRVLLRSAKRMFTRDFASLTASQNLWTPDKIVKSPFRDIEIPNRTVVEHIWENMNRWADKTAVVCGVTNRSYTYHEVYKQSRNFAAKLRSQLKIVDGEVISIMMTNSPEYVPVILGALESGAEVTTVNPIYTAHEVHRQIELSNPKILVGIPETVDVLKESLKLAKKDLPIIVVKTSGESLPPGTISYEELSNDNNVDHSVLKEVRKTSEDTCFLPYSSGTTGLPKGVELLNRNIVVNCLFQDVEDVRFYTETTASHQDSTLAVLPFYHSYGLVVVLLHKLSIGAKIVTLPKFKPNTFLTALKNHKISLLYTAPPLVLFLGSSADVTKDHLASVNYFICGAAPLPKNDIDALFVKAKPEMFFHQIYGMTEAGPLVTGAKTTCTDRISSGQAISNTEMKIIDGNFKNLGPGEVGELLFRGPQVMKGYRGNPVATKATVTEDGWLRSGDLAKINPNGSLVILDRLKELIKVKGQQVAPAELESVLKEHPGILDAAVIGVPDARMGEIPKAFVVLKEGQNVKEEDVVNFVTERVALYKRIKDVVFIDSIPKNPSGKTLRRVLKDQYS